MGLLAIKLERIELMTTSPGSFNTIAQTGCARVGATIIAAPTQLWRRQTNAKLTGQWK
jgi:hypothetical protein